METILFLCPHAAAKSVIAAAYWNRLAKERGLSLTADAAGTEPDETVSPVVVELLGAEGMDVSSHHPRRVTREELEQAQRVVSMGCGLDDLDIAPERVEQWSDVPMVSQNPIAARDVIHAHVERLMNDLDQRPSQAKGDQHDFNKNWLR